MTRSSSSRGLASLLLCATAAWMTACDSGGMQPNDASSDLGRADGMVTDNGLGADAPAPDSTMGDGGGTTDSGTCTNQCAPGTTQCMGNSVQTCVVGAQGCTSLSAPIACPSGNTCTGGVCAAQCMNQCTTGARRCASGSSFQTCGMQANGCLDWGTSQSCGATATCSNGMCSDICTNLCTPGAKRCSNGTNFQDCTLQANGCYDFGTSQMCPGSQTCSGGNCAVACTNQCTTAGDRRCANGTSFQTCSMQTNGCLDWSATQNCSTNESCTGTGICSATCTNQCTTAGDRRCAGTTGYQTCATQSNGCLDWAPMLACPASQTCSGAGACAACTDGQRRCGTNNDVQTCSGGAWISTASCAVMCTNGMCQDTVMCTGGSYRCNGNVVEVCNSSGTAYLASETCSVACSMGLCTGACTPGAKRCNAGTVETCATAGTSWVRDPAPCTTFCDNGACALNGLDIGTNTDRDGTLVVQGAVLVRSGTTLRSPTGNLTIRATSITVEMGASIVAVATGQDPAGLGSSGSGGCSVGYGGGGGIYALPGATNVDVGPGGRGGTSGYWNCYVSSGIPGGVGGGVIRLIADRINIAGQVTANGAAGTAATTYYGGSGGGSGGGILIASDDVTITGTISAVGGPGGTGTGSAAGSVGGPGRIKILRGARESVTGTLQGTPTRGLLPPLTITSSTHPDTTLFYNDNFTALGMSWNQAFPTRQGYFWRMDTTALNVPTAGTGTFASGEVVSIMPTSIATGTNYFHIAPIDPMSAVGTVENTFRVRINSAAPGVTSMTHPSQTAWNASTNPFFAWTVPNGDANYRGFWYVFDQYGNTTPTATSTFLPITQKQILRSNIATGIWAFHIVSVDTQNRPTKAIAHYQIRIGTDPGNGGMVGQVVDNMSRPVSGARVTLNRDLFTPATTNATGSYNMMTIPAGTYEATITATGFQTQTRMVTIAVGAPLTQNFTVTP